MKPKIKAKNMAHLKKLIGEAIDLNGYECNLNYIDVSDIKSMHLLFTFIEFNGDVSEWDVSNVTDMTMMFYNNVFDGKNGDISGWNVSKVKSMKEMFSKSEFNTDISKWDVSKVEDMSKMFENSDYNHDLSQWTPFKLKHDYSMCDYTNMPVPYWAYLNEEDRVTTINKHILNKELHQELSNSNQQTKKSKI